MFSGPIPLPGHVPHLSFLVTFCTSLAYRAGYRSPRLSAPSGLGTTFFCSGITRAGSLPAHRKHSKCLLILTQGWLLVGILIGSSLLFNLCHRDHTVPICLCFFVQFDPLLSFISSLRDLFISYADNSPAFMQCLNKITVQLQPCRFLQPNTKLLPAAEKTYRCDL